MKKLLVPAILLFSASLAFGQQRPEDQYTYQQGTASVTNAAKTADIIAGVAGKFLHVERVVVACHVAAAGGGGVVNVNHGSTTIFTADADAIGVYILDFGNRGHRSPAAADDLQLEVADAVTTDASCIATGVAHEFR